MSNDTPDIDSLITKYVTRTFTEEEERMIVRALIAIRSDVQDGERKVIDGIIRDGWVRS